MGGQELPFKIDWSSRSKLRGPGEGTLGDLLRKLRDRLAPEAQGVSISYVDDRAMRRLNREHRGVDQTTDVLSFPCEPEPGAFPHLGDLVISLPVADKMAQKLGVSRRREVETLVIHGFLHLCGHDHERDQGEMLALQAQLERELLGEEPLPMAMRRGRKPGSKLKQLKDGTRVVVTGRAAQALVRREKVKQERAAQKKQAAKAAAKPRPPKDAKAPRRGPGRPPKRAPEAAPPARPRRRKPARARSGIIA